MPIENVRLSQKEKDQLVSLKRATGIEHWNVLCRWAFCLSLAEPTPPPRTKIISDSNVEMTWKTFAGDHPSLYLAMLQTRCRRDGFDENDAKVINDYFKHHLLRGIGYLFANHQKQIGPLLSGLIP